MNYFEGDFYATEHAVPVHVFANTNAFWAYLCLKQLNLNQYATATAQPGLSVNKILDVPIALPPANEQYRIVGKIKQYESLLNLLDENVDKLYSSINQCKEKIIELAISGKLVPQDPADEPAEELLRRINPAAVPADKSHYNIPDNWLWVKMNDIFTINPKNQASETLDCGFVPMTNVEDGYSGKHTYEIRKWGEVKKGYCHFQNGDIGVAKISPCFENLKSVIFNSLPNKIGAGTTELVVLRGKEIFAPYVFISFHCYIRPQSYNYFLIILPLKSVFWGSVLLHDRVFCVNKIGCKM